MNKGPLITKFAKGNDRRTKATIKSVALIRQKIVNRYTLIFLVFELIRKFVLKTLKRTKKNKRITSSSILCTLSLISINLNNIGVLSSQ